MLPYTTFDDIIKNLRKVIIEHVGLDNNRVLNTTTVRGADLAKIINESQLNSFNLSDSFIIFELRESTDNTDYYIIDENDLENSIITRYSMDLKLYGNACRVVSLKILSVFREQYILQDLYEKGIHFTGISKPESANEFINNTLWKRSDMTIHLEARIKVEKSKQDEYFDEEMSGVDISSKLVIKEIDDV